MSCPPPNITATRLLKQLPSLSREGMADGGLHQVGWGDFWQCHALEGLLAPTSQAREVWGSGGSLGRQLVIKAAWGRGQEGSAR